MDLSFFFNFANQPSPYFRRKPTIKRTSRFENEPPVSFGVKNPPNNHLLLDKLQNLHQSIAFDTMPEQPGNSSAAESELLLQHPQHLLLLRTNPDNSNIKASNKPVGISSKQTTKNPIFFGQKESQAESKAESQASFGQNSGLNFHHHTKANKPSSNSFTFAESKSSKPSLLSAL